MCPCQKRFSWVSVMELPTSHGTSREGILLITTSSEEVNCLLAFAEKKAKEQIRNILCEEELRYEFTTFYHDLFDHWASLRPKQTIDKFLSDNKAWLSFSNLRGFEVSRMKNRRQIRIPGSKKHIFHHYTCFHVMRILVHLVSELRPQCAVNFVK